MFLRKYTETTLYTQLLDAVAAFSPSCRGVALTPEISIEMKSATSHVDRATATFVNEDKTTQDFEPG